MKKAIVIRKVYGGVQEAFRQSYTYWVDSENAKIVGEAAGFMAVDVVAKDGGFEFLLNCPEDRAKEIAADYAVNLLFVPTS